MGSLPPIANRRKLIGKLSEMPGFNIIAKNRKVSSLNPLAITLRGLERRNAKEAAPKANNASY